jgi:MFS family permease
MSMDQPLERPIKGAWTGAVMIFFIGLMCYADRALPRLLMESIKSDFALSDTQIAMLTGFSFSFAMSVFALPLSWIADRWNRARLIAISITVWCGMTLACGFAHDFWTLFVLRMGVGLGEAALIPAAYSLLADMFPAKQLARPLALVALSSMLGDVVAFNGGGFLFDLVEEGAKAGTLPVAAGDAWRVTMIVFGAVGLLVALATVFLLREPARIRAAAEGAGPARISLPGYIRASAFFFVPFIASMVLFTLYNYGFNAWLAPFFERSYGWGVGKIGQAIGTVGLVTGLVSVPLGIWFNDLVQKRHGRLAPVASLWILLAMTIVPSVLMPFAPTGWLAVLGFAVIILPQAAATVITPIAFTTTAPSHLRARMAAFCNLIFGLFGSSMGALVYAAFTDQVLHDPAKVYITLSLISGVLLALIVPLLMLADHRYTRVKALAEAS